MISYFKKIELYSIASIFFIVPVFFGFHLFYSSFTITKTYLFFLLVELLAIARLIRYVYTQQTDNQIIGDNNKNIFRAIPALFFLLVLFFSSLFSRDPSASFFGSYERMMGFITFAHLAVFAFIIARAVRSRDEIKILLWGASIGSFLVSLYGILQVFGIDASYFDESIFETGRVTSTIGQPNYLGAYSLFIIPINCLLFYWYRNVRYARIFLFGTVFLSLITLFLTFSRSSWLGFIAMCGLFFVYGIYTRGIKKIITPTIGVSIFIVFIFISSIFISGATRYREHFFGVFDTRIDTGAYRKIWWKHSIDIIKNAPLFGYGLETERAQFVRYYQPTDALYETINTHPDRAHNELLNYLIIAGWPGLIGFLFFFGSLVFYSFRAARNNDETEKNRELVFFLSLAGYFVYLQFSFSTIIDLIFLWGIAGMVIKILPRACRANSFFDFFIFKRVSEMKLPFHFRANEENIGLLSSIFKKIATLFSHPKLNIRNHAIRYLAIVFIASAGLFIIFEINLRPLIADYYFARLMLFTPAFPDKLRLYEKVFRWNGGERYYRDQYALTLLGNLEQYATNEHKSAIARIVEESYETMKVNKLPMWSALRYAEAKTLRGYFENNEDLFREAEKIFSSRANESPAMPIIYSEWCRLYILWNRYGDAEQLCKKAFSLYPLDQFKTTDRRRQNAMAYEIGLTLSRLAIIYGYDGRNREAINAYQKILLYLPFNQNTYKRLLELYEEIGDTENAKQIKQKGSAVWPDEQSFR